MKAERTERNKKRKPGGIKKVLKIIGIVIAAFFVLCIAIAIFTPSSDRITGTEEPKSSAMGTAQPEESEASAQTEAPIEGETEPTASIETGGEDAQPTGSGEAETQMEEVQKPEEETTKTGYGQILDAIRYDIDCLLAQEKPDTEKLREDYELLLSIYVNEYIFKSYGYGYLTGDFDTEKFDDLAAQSKAVCEEMKLYIDAEEVDSWYMRCVMMADQSFDWGRFDYDSILVGDKSNPDVDTMWENYITAFLEG